MTLELVAPDGEGEDADRISAVLAEQGEAWRACAFARPISRRCIVAWIG
jgi:hypothetical protein